MSDIKVTTIVNDILQSCTYILEKGDFPGVYLIDCGESEPILGHVSQNGKIVEGIILTHAHYDHIYGINDILDKFPNAKVIAGEKTLAGLGDVNLNMSYLYTDDDYIVSLSPDNIIVADRDLGLNILGETLECLPTPGHDVDCMTYILGDKIFTGDSYNPLSPVFTKWKNSNEEQAHFNEQMIRQIINDRKLTVFPGHKLDEQ
jgi:glyoxylase-like metal-dependent hydrolase (beta-lactamase superfamily II)